MFLVELNRPNGGGGMPVGELEYEQTQPYRLGMLYKKLGEMLMDPHTTMRDIAEFGHNVGFQIGIEIQPVNDSELNGA